MATKLDPGWSAVLFFRDAEGEEIGARDITSDAEACEPLARAVVLAVAIAIDPRAGLSATAESVRLEDITPEEAGDPADPADHVDSELPPGLGSTESGDGQEEADVETNPPPAADMPPIEPPRVIATASAVWGTGMVPGSGVPGLQVAARGRLVHPNLAWGFGGFSFASRDENDLGLSLTAAWLDVCGALRPFEILDVHTCGRLTGGIYQVYALRSDETVPDRPGEKGWGAAGLTVGADLHVIGPLVASIELATLISLTQRRFRRRTTLLFEEAPVGILASIGLGAAF